MKLEREIIAINVGGKNFETLSETLKRAPGTFLPYLADGLPHPKCDHFSTKDNRPHFFFDRDHSVFKQILTFIRHKEDRFHLPKDTNPSVIVRELEFWDVDTSFVAECCRNKITKGSEDRREIDVSYNKQITWKSQLRSVMFSPCDSKLGKLYIFVSVAVGLLGIINLITSSMPGVGFHRNIAQETAFRNACFPNVAGKQYDEYILRWGATPDPVINMLDMLCNVFFLLEFFAAFVAFTEKKRFLTNPIYCIDLLYILPYWISVTVFMLVDVMKHCWVTHTTTALLLLCNLRTIRTVYAAYNFKSFRLLVTALRSSIKEMFLYFLLLLCTLPVTATLLFIFEFFEPESEVRDLPKSYWLSYITMTTVGYGDITPKSPGGYVVAALCAMMGVVLLALPVSIMQNKFQDTYGSSCQL